MTTFAIRSFAAAALMTAAAFCGPVLAADANRATQAELESVKGIGPAMAERILAERQKAPFKNWADMIERVKGLGEGNAARYAEAGLTVGNEAFKPAGPPTKAPAKAEPKPATKG